MMMDVFIKVLTKAFSFCKWHKHNGVRCLQTLECVTFPGQTGSSGFLLLQKAQYLKPPSVSHYSISNGACHFYDISVISIY